MRITGLATGLDMDEIVKSSMQPYRIKIQTQQQQKEILEIKQKLYRDVIQDSRDFYNKYFDVSKSNSILLSKNWGNTTYTSSNESAVSVKGLAGAKGGNYLVSGTKATASKAEIHNNIAEGDKVVVNEKEFTLRGKTESEIAKNLNADLKSVGIKVEARYSKFSNGGNGDSILVLESKVLGKDGGFTVGGNAEVAIGKQGVDASNAKVTGFTLDDLKNNNGVIKFGEGDTAIEINMDTNKSDDEIISDLKSELAKEAGLNIDVDIADGKITFVSKSEGSISDPKISIGNKSGKFVDGNEASKGGMTISKDEIGTELTLTYGENKSLVLTPDQLSNKDALNIALNGIGLVGKIDNEGNIIIESNVEGSGQVYPIKATKTSTVSATNYTDGNNADIIITDKSNGSVYTHTGSSNTITVDNMQFTISDDIAADKAVSITGKVDTTEVKDMLVNFINDYNTVMENLNTLTMTKRDRSYSPLTDEQKESMSESEIKLWNERVEKGQLSRDSDLTRIANSMKSIMSSMIDGGNLEKFGISPVADYQGTKNGTFTIDETKLTEALENNVEDVMNFFIGTNEDKSKSGIAQQLKDVLYKETVTTSSALIKKAGIEGSATASNNELTKKISKYTQKMEDMEKDFSRREQTLYSKWARVETLMNSLNSQQSYLSSQLGS